MKLKNYLIYISSKKYLDLKFDEKEFNRLSKDKQEASIKSRENYVNLINIIIDNLNHGVKYHLLQEFFDVEIKDNHKRLTIIPSSSKINISQLKAINTSLSSNISVIQGPPGTGKTTTIKSILSTLLFAGHDALLSSTNNKPLNDIYESLEKDNYPLVYFRKIEKSFKNDKVVREYFEDKLSVYKEINREFSHNDLLDYFYSINSKVDSIINCERYNEAKTTMKILKKKIDKDMLKFDKKLLKYPEECGAIKVSFWKKITLLFNKNKIYNFRYKTYCIENGTSINEVENTISEWGRINKTFNRIKKANLKLDSEQQIFEELANELNSDKYKENLENFYSKMSTNDAYHLANTHKCFNGWQEKHAARPKVSIATLSSTHSFKKLKDYDNLKYQELYDYLIIDEAGQVRIDDLIPALAMSRNIIIVGDTKQIPPVNKVETKEFTDIFKDIDVNLLSTINSAQSYVESVISNEMTCLLNEHYRCSPEIIGFSNKEFYENKLKVKNSSQAILEVHDYDADKTVETMLSIINNISKDKTIGVISPNRFDKKLRELDKYLKSARNDIKYGTVHTFQGAECDAIIIFIPYNGPIKGYVEDFLNDPNIINVAVTRAKTELHIVADITTIDSFGELAPLKKLFYWIKNKGITKQEFIHGTVMNKQDELNQNEYLKDIKIKRKVGNKEVRHDIGIKDIMIREDIAEDYYRDLADSVTINNNVITSARYKGKPLPSNFKRLVKNELIFEDLLNNIYSENEYYVLRGPMLKTIIDIDKLLDEKLISKQCHDYGTKAHFDIVLLKKIDGIWTVVFIIELDGEEHFLLKGVINDSFKSIIVKKSNQNLMRIKNININNYK